MLVILLEHFIGVRNVTRMLLASPGLFIPHLIVFTLSLHSKNLVSSAQAFTSLPAPTGSFPLLRYASTATLSTFGSFRCNMYHNKLFPLSGTVQGQGPVQVTAFNTGWSGCYQMHFWFQSAFLTFTYQFL